MCHLNGKWSIISLIKNSYKSRTIFLAEAITEVKQTQTLPLGRENRQGNTVDIAA